MSFTAQKDAEEEEEEKKNRLLNQLILAVKKDLS